MRLLMRCLCAPIGSAQGKDGTRCLANDSFGDRTEKRVAEPGSSVGRDDDQLDLLLARVVNDGLDRASPPHRRDQGTRLAPRRVEQGCEGLPRPVLVLLVEVGRHHGHEQRVWPRGNNFRKNMHEVELGREPLGQPAGEPQRPGRMGAEVCRGENATDLDHAVSPRCNPLRHER